MKADKILSASINPPVDSHLLPVNISFAYEQNPLNWDAHELAVAHAFNEAYGTTSGVIKPAMDDYEIRDRKIVV